MENDGIYFIVVHDSLLVPIESNGWFVPQLTAGFKFFFVCEMANDGIYYIV